MTTMDHQKLKIASRSENIALVEKLINDVCQNFKISEDHYGNILVALTEAVNNAIQHGNKYNPEKSIDILFDSKKDAITFMRRAYDSSLLNWRLKRRQRGASTLDKLTF